MNQQGSSNAAEKVLRVGVVCHFGTRDPRLALDDVTVNLTDQIFETLFTPPRTGGKPIPLLCRGLQKDHTAAKGTERLSAEVADGVLFSDGTPLTAEMVVTSLQKSTDFMAKSDVKAMGNKLIFTLKVPVSDFSCLLSQSFCAVVHEKGGEPLGTGPYRFEANISQFALPKKDVVRLVRNQHYRDNVIIDVIEFRVCGPQSKECSSTIMEAIRAGEIDYTAGIAALDEVDFHGQKFTLSVKQGNSTGILFFNVESKDLGRIEVRQAIAEVVRAKDISEASFAKNALAYTASGLLPTFMGRSARVIRQKSADLEGSPLPKRLRLLIPWSARSYLPKPGLAAEVIVKRMAEIGIQIAVTQPSSREIFVNHLNRGDYDLILAGWIADSPDPADFFEALLHSEAIPSLRTKSPTANNLSRWQDSETDLAIETFRKHPTDANRRVVNEIIANKLPLLPLIHGQVISAHSWSLKGFQASPLSRVFFKDMRM